MRTSCVNRFSMIELLVVIATIGLLSSILIVSLSRARADSKRAVCKNNQRHIHVGLVLYKGIHDNKLWLREQSWVRANRKNPGAIPDILGFKRAALNVHQNKIFFCPEVIEEDRVGRSKKIRYGINFLDIWGNSGFNHLHKVRPDLNWVEEPENFIMWADSRWQRVAIDWVDENKLRGRHLGAANAVVLDGSVRVIPAGRLSYAASVEANEGVRYSHNRERSGF